MRPLLALFALVSSLPAAPDPAPLEAWLRGQKDVRSIEAEFIQERRLPSLKRPVRTPGRLAFRRPGFLRWELGDPPATVAVADGRSVTLAEITARKARRISFDSPEAKRFTLLSGDAFRDPDEFRSRFELIDSRVSNGVYQATLRPTDRRLRSRMPWLFLTIDPGSQRLRALEIELSDGSRIRSVFTRTRINPRLPDDRFRLDLTGYRVR